MNRLALSHKLTLLIVLVLSLVLVATLTTAYKTIASAETVSAEETLWRLVSELAASVDAATRRQATALRALGTDTALRQLLQSDSLDKSRLRELLQRRLSIDSSVRLRIWNREGRELNPESSRRGEAVGESPRAVPGPTDSTRFGPIYLQRDTGVYWVVSPMSDSLGNRIGWIGERRLIGSTPQEQRSIRAFLGGDVAVYFRNDTGQVWVDLAGMRVPVPLGRFRNGLARYSRAGNRAELVAAEADIRNTPWTLVLERPLSSTIAPARASLLRLGLLGMALLVVTGVFVSLISRRFVEPVVGVANAAQTMKAGELDARVDDRLVTRTDEIGQLARSFNDMAAEVQAAHSELEQQVEEAQSLNEELEQAIREVDEANRAKSRFVTRMSHELRTPLNAIAGYLELLEMGIYGPVTQEQLDTLERIRRSERALLSLIDDVLGIARLESGQVRYNIRSVNLQEIVDEAYALVELEVRAKGLRFDSSRCEPTLTGRGDAEKVRQILTNLLSNAIKFTGPEGEITIECRRLGDRVSIDVQDTGIGIAPDRSEVIFEPFVQLRDDLTRTAEGMGLGLAISRELARGMGGDLTVESREGYGSVFTLTLPSDVTAPLGDPAASGAQ